MDRATPHTTLRIIRQEHHCLAAVIKAMQHFTHQIAAGGKAPDLKVFRAMLLYISEYPEKVHHPKEDHFLFAPLRLRTHAIDDTIAALEVQHAQGERMVRELEHALARYELMDEASGLTFCALVDQYAAFYFEHMTLEEDIVLPAAAAHLSEQDWAAADAAFATNRDPLVGADLGADFDRLFSLITTITPAPIGVGPEVE
ncbi:hemerythrin domain-containing protein [Janthinobacterium sp.]|uniref:hemerythrin domain-containing protein n=1 Tax=Janthinobacterium sp. TaxID=1871054 RepID=UPI00293D61A6|nr:hemerythrin domain-containing protein [Janthinobacterium sp.]